MNKIDKIIWILVILVLIVNLADFITTIIGLNMGLAEKSFMPSVFLSISPWLFVSVKLIVLPYLILPFKYCPIGAIINNFKSGRLWSIFGLIVIFAILVRITINNINLIIK